MVTHYIRQSKTMLRPCNHIQGYSIRLAAEIA